MAIHLKAARVNAGMTQQEVCKHLKISKNTLVNYERYTSSPSIERAKQIAELYGMAVDDIIWAKQ